MSRFTKKGYKQMLGRDEKGQLITVSVKVGGYHDKRRAQAVKKMKKETRKNFNAYKEDLKQQKKNVPAHLRASINWSRVPDLFMGGQDNDNRDNKGAPSMH